MSYLSPQLRIFELVVIMSHRKLIEAGVPNGFFLEIVFEICLLIMLNLVSPQTELFVANHLNNNALHWKFAFRLDREYL